jgi:hypothetical protein
MFELTDEETEFVSRCKNFTLNEKNCRGSNIKYKPYAFTEQGIYMLMTVLRGDLAIRQSRALVSTFKRMKDYILCNQNLIGQRENVRLAMLTADNAIGIQKLRMNLGSVERQRKGGSIHGLITRRFRNPLKATASHRSTKSI